jgi:hypothetical protein
MSSLVDYGAVPALLLARFHRTPFKLRVRFSHKHREARDHAMLLDALKMLRFLRIVHPKNTKPSLTRLKALL